MSDILRPKLLREVIGQKAATDRLDILIAAARHRREACPHILLTGPPGLGKTTLAMVIAAEMGSAAHVLIGPTIEKPQQLAVALARLQPGDVLFIDEIHGASKSALETIYPALEDRVIYVPIENGPAVPIQLPSFTLVAATTQPGSLEGPLRDRFNMLALNYYSPVEMQTILTANAGKLGLDADPAAISLLASRCRGTPRVGNQLLSFARDVATCEAGRASNGHPINLTVSVAEKALGMMQIDDLGLNAQDRAYLKIIAEVYGGGPVGADAIAATMGVKADTIAAVIEPFILARGLIVRTQRGRKTTEAAARHLAAQSDAMIF